MTIESLFKEAGKRKAKIAVFLSGTGSNAGELLGLEQLLDERCPFEIDVLVTDNANTQECNAQQLGSKYHKPLVQIDVKKHYFTGGLDKVTLKTERGRQLRKLYTERLRQALVMRKLDFAAFCGFETLTNIVDYFPCLNVHPGDLTYKKDGKPHLVGLHKEPILKAFDEKLPSIRSSVAILRPYNEENLGFDDGPVLALGPEINIDYSKTFENKYHKELCAERLQSQLKTASDHVVLPKTVQMFAEGNIGIEDGRYYFKTEAGYWKLCPIKIES